MTAIAANSPNPTSVSLATNPGHECKPASAALTREPRDYQSDGMGHSTEPIPIAK